jgi:hypothetical protein
MNVKSKPLDRRVKDLILSKGYPCNPKSGNQPSKSQSKSLKLPYRFKGSN